MKKVIGIFIACAIIFVYTNLIYAESECKVKCHREECPKLIVQGYAKIEILADKAYFNINVRAEEKKLERAFEESAKKIKVIQQTLNSFGVKKEDIRNLGYVYHPLYEGKRIFTTISRPSSYEVVYAIRATVYNMENLGKILVELSDVTETTIYGLTYTSTKMDELKREVLKEAANDAKQKAVKLAEGAGAILGKVIKIESFGQDRPVSLDRSMANVAEKRSFVCKMKTPQLESGYIEISGTCTVWYAIQ